MTFPDTTFTTGTTITSNWLNAVNDKCLETVSVKDFGAVGDGVTDDTAAIQAALNSGAGNIYIPDGTYVISSITLNSNQTLFGGGAASILLQKASPNFTRVIVISGKSYVNLHGFVINGNGNAQASGEQNHGIFIADSSDVNIYNIVAHDCQGDCFAIYSSSSAVLAKRIRICNTTTYNLGRDGITVSGYGAFDVIIDGNISRIGTVVTTSTSNGSGIHLELDNAGGTAGNITISNNTVDSAISSSGAFVGMVISNNTISNIQNGSGFGLITSINPQSISISNNTIVNVSGTSQNGIYIEDTSGYAQNISITGNTLTNITGIGIYAYSAFTTSVAGPLIIDGNSIIECSDYGIEILAYMHYAVISNNSMRYANGGIKIGGTNGIIVSNNNIQNIDNNIGILFANQGSIVSNGATVIGNIVSNATPGTSVGIYLSDTSSVSNIRIIGNDFTYTGTPMSLGTSTTGISHVMNMVGNGTATGSFTLSAAATTTIANTNILSTSQVILTPTNASAAALMGSAKCLYVSNKTDVTSFTVATSNGTAAAGTETFNYFISN